MGANGRVVRSVGRGAEAKVRRRVSPFVAIAPFLCCIVRLIIIIAAVIIVIAKAPQPQTLLRSRCPISRSNSRRIPRTVATAGTSQWQSLRNSDAPRDAIRRSVKRK